METFTLAELILAHRLLFPADFERLWIKYDTSEQAKYNAAYHTLIYKHHRNILSFINEYKPDDEIVKIVSKMIRDVLSGDKE